MTEEPLKYSFRNTPTRTAGEGVYNMYFLNGKKCRGGNMTVKKSLMFGSNSTLNDESNVTAKNLLMRQHHTKVARKKKGSDGSDYEPSDDECSEVSEFMSEMSLNKTSTLPRRLLKESSVSKTPSAANKRRSGIVRRNTITGIDRTPGMQKRAHSCLVDDGEEVSPYEKARIKLHVANTPDCLPCRDKQFADIYNFIETNLKNQTGGCMYISGVPGTGKTLTTRQVVICLKEAVSSSKTARAAPGALPNFKFIEVNAFQVTEPHQIYKLIYKELTDESVSTENAVILLEKKFENKSMEPVVLLVDELDMLCTKKQDVLYNLFDWPYKRNSKWIVVAIANAMNLPEQVSSKVTSRLGLTRLTFQPYSHPELNEIVRMRLEELDSDLFDSDAIQYAARKVASVSGDARRALEICRRATELAEHDYEKKKDKSGGMVRVNIIHVDQAIKHMFGSPKIEWLKSASLQEQLFMQALSILYKSTGREETTLDKVFEQHAILQQKGQKLNRTQLFNVCCNLSASKLILLEPSRNINLQRVRCNMNVDDVEWVLQNKNIQ